MYCEMCASTPSLYGIYRHYDSRDDFTFVKCSLAVYISLPLYINMYVYAYRYYHKVREYFGMAMF